MNGFGFISWPYIICHLHGNDIVSNFSYLHNMPSSHFSYLFSAYFTSFYFHFLCSFRLNSFFVLYFVPHYTGYGCIGDCHGRMTQQYTEVRQLKTADLRLLIQPQSVYFIFVFKKLPFNFLFSYSPTLG